MLVGRADRPHLGPSDSSSDRRPAEDLLTSDRDCFCSQKMGFGETMPTGYPRGCRYRSARESPETQAVARYETVITPPHRWSWPVRGGREYRDLIYFLTKRSSRSAYKQSFFGVGWAVLQPSRWHSSSP